MKSNSSTESYYNVGQISPDNNYAIGFVNKIDALGNEIWNKKVNKIGSSDCFFGGCSDTYGGVLAGGAVYFPDQNHSRGWLVHMDKDGNKQWDRLYTTPHPEFYDDYIYDIVHLPDGSFVAAGSSFGLDEAGFWSQEGWLLRVDSNGCSTPNCSGDLAINETPSGMGSVDVYPNPSNGLIYIERDTPFPSQTTVSLLDNSGRIIKLLSSPSGKNKMQYDLESIKAGIYYLQVEAQGSTIHRKITISP